MTDPVIKPEHRELVCRAYNGDDSLSWEEEKWLSTGDPVDLPHLERLALALATLEATVEARVRRELAELLSAVDAMVNGFIAPGQSREEMERGLMRRLVSARSKFPYPCAAVDSGPPCPGAKEEP